MYENDDIQDKLWGSELREREGESEGADVAVLTHQRASRARGGSLFGLCSKRGRREPQEK